MPLTLSLVNDYEVVVRGLTAMLEPYRDEIEIRELSANAPLTEPVDIVLYDTFAQPQGEKASVSEILANPLVSHVVVYTWNFEHHVAQASLALGAAGYLSKGLPAGELIAALRKIANGGEVISADAGLPTGSMNWPGREEGLTPRESEVLSLITQGLSNNEIAEITTLSINSIKSYIRTCYRKIGVKNRSNAILWGVSNGFVPDHKRIG